VCCEVEVCAGLITRPDSNKPEGPCWQRGSIFVLIAQGGRCSFAPSHWIFLCMTVCFIKRDWKRSAQS